MKSFKIFIILNIFLFILGCDEKEEYTLLNGSIVGLVNLIDEDGNETKDKSGVIVSIEGLKNSTQTNERGRFELSNVMAGTYNMIFDKPDYGTFKRSFQFVGGNVPALISNTTLYKKPSLEIQNLDFSFKEDRFYISGNITKTNSYAIQVCISDSSNVSNLNNDSSFIVYCFTGGFEAQFSLDFQISEMPYYSGKKVYLVLYLFNPYEDYLYYYDYEKEMYVITSCKKASDVLELILD